ncbi:MAG: HK97 family phage prohead protease, partial [Actinomycetota bacterium]|nr:HK97 family phage prohead protease [Actinomycetota bacterium]
MSTIAPEVLTVPIKWAPASRSATTSRKLVGTAAVFGQTADRLGFAERIERGAFADAIRDGDPFLVFGHNELDILARKSAGSLRLRETVKGLEIEADVVKTTLGNDVLELVRTGHLSEMSFQMSDVEDHYENGERVITRVGQLWEVSCVPLGAYSQTSVEARASKATLDRIERVTGVRPMQVRDRSVYGPDSKFSYWRDFVTVEAARQAKEARFGSPAFEYPTPSTHDNLHGGLEDAKKRIASAEARDIGSSAMDPFCPATGGDFVGSLFETSARARAVVALQLTQAELPRGGMRIDIPRITTGATAATQTELGNVSETDPATSQATGAVKVIAGQVDLAMQLFDQSPGGVADQAISQELGEAIGTGLDVSIITALLAVSGLTSLVYTDTTVTVAENFGQLVNLRQLVHAAAGEAPDLLVLHPRRLSFFDTTAANTLQYRTSIVPTPSIPVNLGASTTEDRCIYIVKNDVIWFTRPPVLSVMFEPGSA